MTGPSTPRFSAEQLARIDRLAAAVLQVDGGARRGYLEQQCPDDPDVCAEVLALIELAAEDDDGFLAQPAELPPTRAACVPQSHATLPERIGRYRILAKLGEGGMGVVYLAEQDDPQRKVAIKVVRGATMSDELRRRFRHEVHVLGHLKHPGIAQIFEAATDESQFGMQPYFVMEYIEGRPLDAHIAAESLDCDERVELCARVCDAVHHAHQKGVIHRDLKPGNVLVVPDDRPAAGTASGLAVGQPKILDFGIARATDADVHTIQTHTGQIVGTIPYMSPEQISGHTAELDTRSDVYALGVLLFEALTGQLPYAVKGRPLVEAMRMIREEEPARMSAIAKAPRGDLENIVSKALEKEPERRYDSAAEMAADLRRYLHDEPILARPQTTFYQLRKFAARNRALVGALVAVVVVLCIGVISSMVFAFRELDQRRLAEARFEDLHGFASRVIVDYQRILNREGATRGREYLATTARDYLDSMARDTQGLDGAVLHDLAQAYSVIGDTLGQMHASNLGDPAGALDNYGRAIEIYENLLRRDMGSVNTHMALAVACERAGNVHLEAQRYDEALEFYQRAGRIKADIADEHPIGRLGLSYNHNKLADVYIKTGRLQDAHDMYVRSLEIRKELANESTDDQVQRGVSVGLNRVAGVLIEMERADEALVYYEASLERRRARLARMPDNDQARMDMAVGHIYTATCLVALERHQEALAGYDSSMAVLQGMAAEDPGNITVKIGIAEVHADRGEALCEVGRPEEGLAALDEAIAIIEAQYEGAAVPAAVQVVLGKACAAQIRALEDLGRDPEAALARKRRARLLADDGPTTNE